MSKHFSGKTIRGIGMLATLIGGAATLIGQWVQEQQINEAVEQKVSEALARREDEEES